jgi:hypothetical protein
MPLLGNNYLFQMTETGFTEQFYASHRMGSAHIFSMKSLNQDHDPMIPSSTHLFSHWSIPVRTPLKEGIKSQEDDPIQHGIQSRLLQRKAFLIVYWKNTPVAIFIVPDWGIKLTTT